MTKMSKVLVTVPPGLLERIDRAARRRGLSRSAFLRQAAEREIGSASDSAASLRRLHRLQEEIACWEREHAVEPYDSTAAIREDRDSGHSV